MGNFNFKDNHQPCSDHLYFPNPSFPYEEFSKELNNNNINKIGKGTFSNIYKVMNKYAIKTINENILYNLESITELSILHGLNCVNIIKSHGYYILNGKLCMVMDYYEYNLSDCMNISLNDKKIVIKQLYEAIKYLHERNILHLDIKPENVLMNVKMIPKIVLADFSLSCKIDNESIVFKEHKITSYYRPYENLKGSYEYSKKSDLWSFGILINELIKENKIENRLMNIHMLENDTFSIQLYIEKMYAWKIWPPKYSLDLQYVESFLNVDKDKRNLNHNIINSYSQNEMFHNLCDKLSFKYNNKSQLYDICNIITKFLYGNQNDILNIIESTNIHEIIKTLAFIKFEIFN